MPGAGRLNGAALELNGAVPFRSAFEAWFWTCGALKARLDGAVERAGMSLEPRPCEPVDILLALQRLRQRGRLRQSHVETLMRYGSAFTPPPRWKSFDLQLWEAGLSALDRELRSRNIVV